jgi:hypothetical protein
LLKIPVLHVEFLKATVTSEDMNWCCLPRTKKQENPYSNSIGGKNNVFACCKICRIGMQPTSSLVANCDALSQLVLAFQQFYFQNSSLEYFDAIE